MMKHQVYPSSILPGQALNNPTSYRFMNTQEPEQRMQGEYRKKIQHYSFLLSDKIGKGYSSTVYKGLDDLTHQQVAIKVIDLKSLRDSTSKLMLQTEIQCFQDAQHPNILKFYHSYYTTNNCYIVTEYCPGGDFSHMLKKKGKIPEAEALTLFMQIFEGYKAFYQAGYVHRDLKPANILVGKDGQLKLADFGFSKKRTLVDRQNYNVGTPIYMPRQSLAANIYNEKTDTWALGITLYEMIYGIVPFRGRSQQELRVNIEKGIIYFPQDVPVSEELKDFLKLSLLNDSMKRLGVKQMERHPWMMGMTFTQKNCKESPEKVSQENMIRASLPHDLVNHNKSREYFQNIQNRRSVSTTQKLKLCMPKKGSHASKPRQVLVDRTDDNINRKYSESLQNKENKYNNYSTNSTRQDIKSNRKNVEKNQGNAIQKIVGLINYFRFLYQILEKAKNVQHQVSSPTFRLSIEHAEKALSDRVSEIFKKHLISLSDKSNQFNLNSSQWIQFATSERWRMYQFVIQKYQTKYGAVIEQANKHAGEWENAQRLYIQLGRYLHNGSLDKILLRERYACLQLLGLLSHLCTLDKIIERQGWDAFTLKFTNESILLESYSVNMENYLQLEAELAQNYLNLKEEYQ